MSNAKECFICEYLTLPPTIVSHSVTQFLTPFFLQGIQDINPKTTTDHLVLALKSSKGYVRANLHSKNGRKNGYVIFVSRTAAKGFMNANRESCLWGKK